MRACHKIVGDYVAVEKAKIQYKFRVQEGPLSKLSDANENFLFLNNLDLLNMLHMQTYSNAKLLTFFVEDLFLAPSLWL